MRKALIIIAVFIVLVGVSCLVSYSNIGVVNPFAAIIGKMQVTYTDVDFVVVQNYPKKIVFPRVGYSLEDYMGDMGYAKTDQLGASFTFEKGGEVVHAVDCGGGFFIRWRFED